jgi:UDP-glucose 4-epimerase
MWREYGFSGCDAVLHLAGIAHSQNRFQNREEYDAVNRDLAAEVACAAKDQGVRQFIFLSSASVYGMDQGMITQETVPRPATHYGRSKLEAENLILALSSETFTVSVLRAPMVYGKDCPGNYQILRKIALRAPFFPDIENQRSMIHIDNLCECIRLVWESRKAGLIFPQNNDYVSTRDRVSRIAEENGRKIAFVPWFNGLIRWMTGKQSAVTKAFGNLTYDMALSADRFSYAIWEKETHSM